MSYYDPNPLQPHQSHEPELSLHQIRGVREIQDLSALTNRLYEEGYAHLPGVVSLNEEIRELSRTAKPDLPPSTTPFQMIAPLYTRVDASHAISKRLLTEIRTATRGFALCLLEGFFSAQHTGFFGLTPLQCHEWEQVARNSRGNIVRNLEGLATFVEMLDQAMGGVGHHLNEVEKEIVVFGARNGGDWEWADWTKRKDGRLLNTFY